MTSFFFYLTITLFILVCLFMILLILIQKGRGGGLASAFGGAGGNTAFGSKTGDVLTWATSIVFGVFLVLAVALNLFADARQNNQATAAGPGQPAPGQQTPSDVPGPGPLNIPTTPDPILQGGTQPPAPLGQPEAATPRVDPVPPHAAVVNEPAPAVEQTPAPANPTPAAQAPTTPAPAPEQTPAPAEKPAPAQAPPAAGTPTPAEAEAVEKK